MLLLNFQNGAEISIRIRHRVHPSINASIHPFIYLCNAVHIHILVCKTDSVISDRPKNLYLPPSGL